MLAGLKRIQFHGSLSSTCWFLTSPINGELTKTSQRYQILVIRGMTPLKQKLATKIANCLPYFRELTFSAPEKIDGWKTILVFSNGPLFWENSFIFGRVSFLVVDRLISIWNAVRCFVFKGHQVIDLKMTQQNLHHQMLHGLFAYAGSGSIVSHLCLNVGDKIPTRSIWVINISITCQTFFPCKIRWNWS